MASALPRNGRLRLIYRSFDSHWRSLKVPFHSLSKVPIQNSHSSLLSPDFHIGIYKSLGAFALNHRFLCTTATNSSVNQSSSLTTAARPSSGLAEGNSESGNSGGQGSAGSQDSSQQGKPVRGGMYLMYLDAIEILQDSEEKECFVCLPPEPRRRWLQRILHRRHPLRYSSNI